MSQLQIETISLGELDTNCYLAWCEETKEALIIDPADAGESIADQVLALQLQPSAILLTHAHFDHVLGLLATQLSFDVPAYLHEADTFLLKEAQKSAEYWLKHPVDPVPEATFGLYDGAVIKVGQCQVSVVHTPGHTPGSCAFLWQQTQPPGPSNFSFTEPSALFVGDVIFENGIGSTDHRYSSKKELFSSIQKLRQLGPLRVYPGHGPSFLSQDNSLLQRSS